MPLVSQKTKLLEFSWKKKTGTKAKTKTITFRFEFVSSRQKINILFSFLNIEFLSISRRCVEKIKASFFKMAAFVQISLRDNKHKISKRNSILDDWNHFRAKTFDPMRSSSLQLMNASSETVASYNQEVVGSKPNGSWSFSSSSYLHLNIFCP